MTSETLTVMAPVAIRDTVALPLAMALGQAAGDAPEEWAGAFKTVWQTEGGTEWGVFGTTRDLTAVTAALASPEMADATQALVIWRTATGEDETPTPMPTVETHPGMVIAIIGPDTASALRAAGLKPIPAEDDL